MFDMKKYCEKCNKEVETKIVMKSETYTVHGESIQVDAKVCVCNECGEELFDEELDNDTLLKVFDEYRKNATKKRLELLFLAFFLYIFKVILPF